MGVGTMYAKNDGSIQYFCSSKCRKSLHKFHRDPRKFKWTDIRKKQSVKA